MHTHALHVHAQGTLSLLTQRGGLWVRPGYRQGGQEGDLIPYRCSARAYGMYGVMASVVLGHEGDPHEPWWGTCKRQWPVWRLCGPVWSPITCFDAITHADLFCGPWWPPGGLTEASGPMPGPGFGACRRTPGPGELRPRCGRWGRCACWPATSCRSGRRASAPGCRSGLRRPGSPPGHRQRTAPGSGRWARAGRWSAGPGCLVQLQAALWPLWACVRAWERVRWAWGHNVQEPPLGAAPGGSDVGGWSQAITPSGKRPSPYLDRRWATSLACTALKISSSCHSAMEPSAAALKVSHLPAMRSSSHTSTVPGTISVWAKTTSASWPMRLIRSSAWLTAPGCQGCSTNRQSVTL